MSLPDYIPSLPLPGTASLASWPPNIVQAYQILSDLYSHALQALRTDAELLRLQFHAQAILNDAFPIILAFEQGEDRYSVLIPWVQHIAEVFSTMLKEFRIEEERIKHS